MSIASQTVLELWRKVSYLDDVSGPALADLAAAAVRHAYSQGQMIFLEGDPNEGLYLVEQGTVKICRFAADGREHILHLVHPGDTFNDVAALDGGPNPACATAFQRRDPLARATPRVAACRRPAP